MTPLLLLGTPYNHSQGRVGKKYFLCSKSFQFSNILGMSGVNHSLELMLKHLNEVKVRTEPHQMVYFVYDLVLYLKWVSC